MFLMDEADFNASAGSGKKNKGKSTRSVEEGRLVAEAETGSSFHLKRAYDNVRPPQPMQKEAVKMPVDTVTLEPEVLPGSYFEKWGRNGKSKKRYVMFDEDLQAILWKSKPTDRSAAGVLELSNIQDIVVGIQTPVLNKVAPTKLDPNCVFSIVADQRTLDLQAETVEQQVLWVNSLRLRYSAHVKQRGFANVDAPTLPKELSRKLKIYSAPFRSSLCSLRNSCEKLQAITSYSDTFKAVVELAGKSPQLCHGCGGTLIAEANFCKYCGRPALASSNTRDVEELQSVHIS